MGHEKVKTINERERERERERGESVMKVTRINVSISKH